MTEYAICDVCGRRLRRVEFFCVPDEVHKIGFCKRCAREMFEDDEEDDLEYLALTAHYFKQKQDPVKKILLPHAKIEQLTFLHEKDGQ